MLNIAFNACNSSLGGVTNYVEMMATEFPAKNPDLHFTIFLSTELSYIAPLANTTLVFIDNSKWLYRSRFFWEQVLLPIQIRKRKIDLLYTFFATDVFLSPCPTVIRIGNMAPYNPDVVRLEREFVPRLRLYLLKYLSKLSAHTSDATLVQSKYAADELIAYSGFPAAKTHGLNRGYEISNMLSGGDATKEKIDGQFILCVGHVHRYKMLMEVISGYQLARTKVPDLPKLVIPGGGKDQAYLAEITNLIHELELDDVVLLVGNVSRAELYNMIVASSFCVFSSMVETFPTTLFEQMSAGKALIVSNEGVMAPFCSDSALMYDPRDSEELATHIISCATSPDLVEKLQLRATDRFQELDLGWDKAFNARRALFLRMLGDK